MTHQQYSYRPYYHWFANINVYSALLLLTSTGDGMFWFGATGVISTIEKQYHFSSSASGTMWILPEIGRLSILLFVSHFGNLLNIPQLIGVCFMLVSVGVFLMSVPHYVIKHDYLVHVLHYSTVCELNNSRFPLINTPGPVFNLSYTDIIDIESDQMISTSRLAYGIICLALVVIGLSETPLLSLANAYIIRNSEKRKETLYVAIAESGWALGPILGLLVSAWTTSLYVTLEPTFLTPEDPAWIGAWWLALVIMSACILFPTPFLWCLPKEMPVNNRGRKTVNGNQDGDHDDLNMTEMVDLRPLALAGNQTVYYDYENTADDLRSNNYVLTRSRRRDSRIYTWKGLFKAIKRLVKNPAFLSLTLGYAFWGFSGWGMMSFFPKFYEIQFSLPTWKADIITGLVTGVSFGLGRILSGIFMTVSKIRLKKAFLMCTVLTSLAFVVMVLSMFLGCDNVPGIITDSRGFAVDTLCQGECNCSGIPYAPVCDQATGHSYFSPCHAGCLHSNASSDDYLTYSSCSCTQSQTAISGTCRADCRTIIPFTAVLVIFYFLLAFTSPPLVVFTMRCVDKQDMALAYGIVIFFISLFGWLPAPALYGHLIDGSCRLWEDLGNGHAGYCLLYNLPEMRYRIQGVTAACRAGQVICFIAVLYFAKNKWQDYENRSDDVDDDDADNIDD